MDLFFCLVFAVPLYASVLVQALIYVQALVFDLAQLTCQKGLTAICNPGVFCNTPRYDVQLNCGSSFAVGRHL